ncbi:O-antigen ligase family protein [uncultured Polaribacter sp.]|uniref:O-antigen ligase family protein n=1 Tax=uncultured Polaribacter sp. TaxID=174711 RepID=UPI00260CC311|nr:O-antigen ligase family protein [uncultured Polaribacter sp.]
MQLIGFLNFIKRNIAFVFLLSLFSFGLLFSMISSYMGFMGEDNLFSSSIRKFNFFLAFIGVIISLKSKLYQKFLTKELFFLYLLYLYYIFIVKIDLSNIDAAGIVMPTKDKQLIMFRMTRLVFFPMLAVLLFRIRGLNLFKLAKAILISLLVSLILALLVLNLSFGGMVDERLSIEGELNALNMGYWGATLFVLCLFFVTKEKNKIQKIVISSLGFLIAFYIMLISGSRGPILYSLIIFYYYMFITSAFYKVKKIITIVLVFILLILVLDYTILTDIIGTYNPNLEERLISSVEDQEISGRDKLYEIGINQFLSKPITGDYFLLKSGHYKGEYPHNILIEALMTLGLIGAIPFFILLIKTFNRVHYMIKRNDNTSWIALIFLISFFKGMSTWNLYGNLLLWISMGIILSYKMNCIK